MRKTWTILCLAAALVLPLAGCGGGQTGSDMGGATPEPSPAQSVTTPSPMPGLDENGNGNPGDDDLAGADGIVGGNGAGETGNEDHMGQAGQDIMDDLGQGVQDTLDDIGSTARRVGEDARRAMDR